MWRIANCVYRAFRNTATHRCSQDVLIPLSTVCNADDDSNLKEYEFLLRHSFFFFNRNFYIFRNEKCSIVRKCDIYQVLKNHQFSFENIEKLQENLKKISTQQV